MASFEIVTSGDHVSTFITSLNRGQCSKSLQKGLLEPFISKCRTDLSQPSLASTRVEVNGVALSMSDMNRPLTTWAVWGETTKMAIALEARGAIPVAAKAAQAQPAGNSSTAPSTPIRPAAGGGEDPNNNPLISILDTIITQDRKP